MDDALAVRPIERVRDLDAVAQRLLEGQRAVHQSRLERVPLDVFHDQILDVVLSSDVVERADVRMGELGDRLRLALEALPRLGGRHRLLGQHLDRDDAIQPGVLRLVDLAHPTGADRREDLVGAETGARGETQDREEPIPPPAMHPAGREPGWKRHFFFSAAGQSTTSVIGSASSGRTNSVTRKRWPSAVTS